MYEYDEPETWAEQDYFDELADGRKTQECNMCGQLIDPGDIRVVCFWHNARRYYVDQCPLCAGVWDSRTDGEYDTCAVCGDSSCTTLDEDYVEITSFARPHNAGKFQQISSALCQECAVAWSIGI